MYSERIEIFKHYWKIYNYSKLQQTMLMDYYEPFIRTRFLLGEPILGKNCGIYCETPNQILSSMGITKRT